MRTMIIYSPALVLLVWAAVWAVNIQGTAVVVVGLVATALAVVGHARVIVHEQPWKDHHRVRRHA